MSIYSTRETLVTSYSAPRPKQVDDIELNTRELSKQQGSQQRHVSFHCYNTCVWRKSTCWLTFSVFQRGETVGSPILSETHNNKWNQLSKKWHTTRNAFYAGEGVPFVSSGSESDVTELSQENCDCFNMFSFFFEEVRHWSLTQDFCPNVSTSVSWKWMKIFWGWIWSAVVFEFFQKKKEQDTSDMKELNKAASMF